MLEALLWLLEGDARKWWEMALPDIKSREEAHAALTDRFHAVLSNVSLWPQITRIGQRYGQSIVDYLVMMNDKFLDFDPTVEERARIDITQGGFHPLVQQEIRSHRSRP